MEILAGFYLWTMPLWISGVSALSVNTQRPVLGVARELNSVLQGEGSVQGDTKIGHGKSLFFFYHGEI